MNVCLCMSVEGMIYVAVGRVEKDLLRLDLGHLRKACLDFCLKIS
jgi:hypothetical protein